MKARDVKLVCCVVLKTCLIITVIQASTMVVGKCLSDTGKLPKALFLGDDIMFAYEKKLRGLLDNGVESDFAHMPQAGPSWDAIQFNWGLHAAKHVNADEARAWVLFTSESYMENLERFVQELKRTRTMLVFATITPIPESVPGMVTHMDLSAYNDPVKVWNHGE